MLSINKGPCAWNDCSKDDCLILKGRLPSCPIHQKNISNAHNTYKIFAKSSLRLTKLLNNDLTNDERLINLKLIKNLKMAELKGRMLQTNSIKSIYKDKGHDTYTHNLLEEIKNISDEILTISNKNVNCNNYR